MKAKEEGWESFTSETAETIFHKKQHSGISLVNIIHVELIKHDLI